MKKSRLLSKMVETNIERYNDDPRQVQINSSELDNLNRTTPVSWGNRSTANLNMRNIGAAKDNKESPIKVDTSHPLWQTFLDSGTVSPLAFFRIFLSPPTYFHSPTPWRRSTR